MITTIQNAMVFVAVAGICFSITVIILCVASLVDRHHRWM